VTTATALCGAFPVDLDAGDSFEVAELPAGNHTIIAGSESGWNDGAILVEIYFLL
jgi:hypothetical protein